LERVKKRRVGGWAKEGWEKKVVRKTKVSAKWERCGTKERTGKELK
jgi:hypothetical protein